MIDDFLNENKQYLKNQPNKDEVDSEEPSDEDDEGESQ